MDDTLRIDRPEIQIARGVGEYLRDDIVPLAFGGHGLYVRKCMTGESIDEDAPYTREVGGIVLPECVTDQSVYVEVLACGPNVGKRCSKAHAHKYRQMLVNKYGMGSARLSPCVPSEIIGRRALVPLPYPLVDERVKRSPLVAHEFFIEETLPEGFECAPGED